MKKLKYLLLIAILVIPFKIHALEGSVEIECDSAGLYTGKDVNCTISGHSNGIVTGLEAIINYSEDIKISSFKLTSEWEGIFNDNTITNGAKIGAVAKVDEDIEDVEGDFQIATFKVKLKEDSESTSQTIKLSSITFMNEFVQKTYLEDNAEVEFNDFIKMDAYNVNSTKMIIYGLSPMTIGAFKSSIQSNATLDVNDNEDASLEDTIGLATGQLFKVSFRNNRINYKISVLGDVLGNGNVTRDDAIQIAKHIIDGNIITEDEFILAADYDGNETIKMNDVMRLIKSIES